MTLFTLFAYLHKQNKKVAQLLHTEKSTIALSCSRIFRIITRIMVAIFLALIFFGTPFFNFKYLIMYSASFIISLGLCISFSISYRHKGRHYLPLSYAFAAYLYAFSILVSISSPVNESHAATSFICLQIIFPLLIFDRSLRVDALVTLAYLIHTVLSYHYKSFSNFTLDLFNGAAFTIVGIIIGEYERFIRLVNFEKDRILVYQKNTDMLTNLQNRRSLFEYLATSAQRKNAKEASIGGFFMIDIDHFKIFNDTYGHQAGDSCLLQLGAAFLSWGAEHGFTFYRYGGEEFIAVGNQSDYSWLGEQAESLRKAIQELAIPFPQNSPGVVTISLGYAPQTDFRNYEETIKLADEALYTAKRTGRNRVCGSITEQAPAGRA